MDAPAIVLWRNGTNGCGRRIPYSECKSAALVGCLVVTERLSLSWTRLLPARTAEERVFRSHQFHMSKIPGMPPARRFRVSNKLSMSKEFLRRCFVQVRSVRMRRINNGLCKDWNVASYAVEETAPAILQTLSAKSEPSWSALLMAPYRSRTNNELKSHAMPRL